MAQTTLKRKNNVDDNPSKDKTLAIFDPKARASLVVTH
jgi:hypothetical protein